MATRANPTTLGCPGQGPEVRLRYLPAEVSEANVETVRSIFERWRAGDEALDAFDPAIEWDATHFPDGEVFHGREGVRRFFRMWLGTWEGYELEMEAVFDAGDKVVVLTRERGHGKGSSVPMEVAGGMLVTLRAGKVVRWQAFLDPGEALERAGLPPLPPSGRPLDKRRSSETAPDGQTEKQRRRL
jgi:ketosteroid isomerase-like protein